MKINIVIVVIFTVFSTISCKNQLSNSESEKSVAMPQTSHSQKDIFINREIYSGQELKDVTVISTHETQIDSLNYSLYKTRKDGHIIFSLERFIKNDDVKQYVIFDTLNLQSSDIIVATKDVGDKSILSVTEDGKLIKNWSFKNNNISKISKLWIGKYEGTFLRMKEESGDPRSMATIRLTIEKDLATFDLYSYIEEVHKKLNYAQDNKTNLVLIEQNMSKNKVQKDFGKIIYQNEEFFLTSKYLDSITGESESRLYKLKKQLK